MSSWQEQLSDLISPAVARSQATAEVLIAPRAMREAGAMAARATPERCALVMADEAGYGAGGAEAVASLEGAGFRVETCILKSDPLPKASVEEAERFRAVLAADPSLFPISLGSGVVNDLVKYAAFVTGRRYMTIATAASMDGYTSAGAPLAKAGFKVTIPTRAPIAMLADLDVIAGAPAAMNGWGYGDLAGKIAAGGDWIVADAVGAEPIDDVAWPLVQNPLRGWLEGPSGILEGDANAVARLFVGLTAVGFAMEFHGSSRPASGAEHQIAHLWEMEGLRHNGEKVSHGAAVGVGCVAALALYDWLLRQDLGQLDPDAVLTAAPGLETRLQSVRRDISDQQVAEMAEVEVKAKHLDASAHRARLARITSSWPDLQRQLSEHLMPFGDMASMLREAGTPAFAHEIGVSPTHLLRTLRAAQHIRRRYTIFDLLHETGLVETALTGVLPLLGPQRTEAAE
ncbi:MAG: iron-containing alcohol dehydrogenase [Pseudomonadota bacterium]